jgi:predicted DNA repair protein MutK
VGDYAAADAGGAFLCFEGVEKVLHSLQARKHKEDPQVRQRRLEALANQDPMAFERDKVKGAIRTDFILSAEIVAITLGIVAEAPLLNQILILSGIALLVTVGSTVWWGSSSSWMIWATGWWRKPARWRSGQARRCWRSRPV